MVYEWVERRAARRAARKAGADLEGEYNNTEQELQEQEALMGEPDGISSTTEQGQQQQNLLDETVKENESH
jgi:hypothetical protein